VIGVRNLFGRIGLGYRAGAFLPGPAFGIRTATALLQRVELKIEP